VIATWDWFSDATLMACVILSDTLDISLSRARILFWHSKMLLDIKRPYELSISKVEVALGLS